MTQRELVYRYLSRRQTPATRAEIVRATKITHPSVCRRVSELVEQGRVQIVGTRRGAETLAPVSGS